MAASRLHRRSDRPPTLAIDNLRVEIAMHRRTARVVDNVSDGDIILLHDGSPDGSEDRSQTVAALPVIIDTLRARGFEFGTLSTTTGARSGPTGPDVVIGGE